MKYLEDIVFVAGVACLGVGVGSYDWRLGLVVVGVVLAALPVVGKMMGRKVD